MVFELLTFVVGVVIGAMIMAERHQHQRDKTFAEVDAEVRAQLTFYKNQSEGLKEDVAYLRRKIEVLKK